MADYCGFCRSNYFAVKNVAKFKAFLNLTSATYISNDEKPPRHGFYTDGSMPSCIMTVTDSLDIDFMAEISKFLKPDQVAIVQEVGSEAARYVSGYAIAINAKGERQELCLNDIYDTAKVLTSRPENISMAEY